MGDKLLKTKLNIYYFIVFGATACYFPFLAVYFEGKGLSYSQIGILFAVNSLVAVISQPIWGIITDKYLNKRLTLLIVLVLSGLFIFNFVFASSFYFVLLSIILFIMVQSPITSVSDTYCYEIVENYKNFQYGKIRLMGSIGYAIIALILGNIIKVYGINSTFISYALFTVIGIAVLYSIKFNTKSTGASINIRDIVSLVKNKRYVLIVAAAMIINVSMGANGNYLAILIQKTGGDVSKLGILWFIVAMSELPAFFLGSKILERFGVLNVFILSTIFYAGRFFIDSISTSYQIVLAVQLLQGITFPLYMMSTLQYVNTITSPKTRTTAMTVFTAISGGIGGFVGNAAGGFILQSMNVFFLFKILSFVAIVALIMGIILRRIDKA